MSAMRKHSAMKTFAAWLAERTGGDAEAVALAVDIVCIAADRPERLAETPFSELAEFANKLHFVLDETPEAFRELLDVLGEDYLAPLEDLVLSPAAQSLAREIAEPPATALPVRSSPDRIRAIAPEQATETVPPPPAPGNDEAPLTPVGNEPIPANPIEAAPLLVERFARELAAWRDAPASRHRCSRMRERLRLASSALRRTGYRTFATLASELDATFEAQLRSEAPAPAIVFDLVEEAIAAMNAMAERSFPRTRTHYGLCGKLAEAQREIAELAAQARETRRAASPAALRPMTPRPIGEQARKLSSLEELFIEEMGGHLDEMTRQLLLAEENPQNREAIFALMRAAHSIKGSAAITGFKDIASLGHAMEDLMVLVRDEELPMTPAIADAIFRGVDRLQAMRNGVLAGAPPQQDRTQQAIDRVRAVVAHVTANISQFRAEAAKADESLREAVGASAEEMESASSAAAAKIISVDVRHLDSLMNIAADLVIGRTRLTAQLGTIGTVADVLDRKQHELAGLGMRVKRALELERTHVVALGTAGAGAMPASRFSDDFEQSELDRFGEADLAARDLREGIAAVADIAEELRSTLREFDARLSLVAGLITDLRESVRRARLLPIGQVFDRFPRAIRDLSQQLGKPLELKLSGESTLLDKQVLDELADPLMHLVRNAADHGIESTADRVRVGKPAKGTIRLSARQAGGQAIIEVSDDGAGIPIDRVRSKAIERGFMTAAEAFEAKDEQLYALLLRSGFSTAAAVTSVSGRGVGLDVVNETVLRLRGSLTVLSRAGRGTTFVVRLPVSLSIAQGLLLRLGDETYAIPTDSVEEVVLLDPRDLRSVAWRPVMMLRGRPIPLLDLRRHLNVAAPRPRDVAGPYVLIVGEARAPAGLVIDSIAGIEEFVQKSFGDYLGGVEGFAGATVLADGRVTLILDALQLATVLEPVHSELARRDAAPEPIEELAPLAPPAAEQSVEDLGGDSSASIPGPRIPAILDALPSAAPEPPAGPTLPAARTQPHILVVDDSVSVRRYVASILETAQLRVTMAVDGVDALEKIAETDFDLVLTDLEMPRMHGFELITELKAHPRFRAIPIVILTGRMGEKHSRKGIELGAAAYLVKPFEEAILVATVREALGSRAGELPDA